jgi:hypothetical protein
MFARRKLDRTKMWNDMNLEERHQRILLLWGKVRTFVRLRNNLKAVQADIEIAEEREMLDQGSFSEDESDQQAYNSNDE